MKLSIYLCLFLIGLVCYPRTLVSNEPLVTIPEIGPIGPIEVVHSGLKFAEGPAADAEGTIYFSDVFANRVLKANAGGEPTVVLEDSQGTNGMMFLRTGVLMACQGNAGRVILIDIQKKTVSPFAESYLGQKFLRPNDLVVDMKGGVYFTDPKIGKGGSQGKSGVYYAAQSQETLRLADDLIFPNGIVLSPDERTLFVVQYSAPEVMAYPVVSPGKLGEGRVFFSLPQKESGKKAGGDGLTIDTQGNLYFTVPALKSLAVVSPKGQQLGMISLPALPTNCAFGGKEMKTLYVTTPNTLLSMPMQSEGHRFGAGK